MTAYLPPLLIDVRVQSEEARSFHIWLPLVVLWPVLAVLIGFVLIVTALVDLALWLSGARYHHYSLVVINAMRLLAEVRGTHVDAVNDDGLVNVHIY